ncbi:hypothetical protein [Pyxidicoccus xibeiensis]|uniref:hypothetical protein n=1 Tax=Pyxidicoccus xibeiensis TaxID=2906759 RepID=UPI0020A71D99|nr:hypothetical protein [Pyxidicoccus xibeiensis]MCP3142491.1 hypothetical protein [Pyxidicoccus xibeiensis]
MLTPMLDVLSWFLLGVGVLIDAVSFVLLLRAVTGKKVASGAPGVALFFYLCFYGIRTLAGLPWHGGLLLGLFSFHVLVHLGLPLMLRDRRS